MTSSNIILRLSSREFEVFELRKLGIQSKEIAKKLNISCRTLENHISNILNKGGFLNSLQMVAFDGEIVVARKIRIKNSEKCKIIKESLLQGLPDDIIRSHLEIGRHTYGMLKRLVLNDPGVSEKLNHLNTKKPMFKWLRYA